MMIREKEFWSGFIHWAAQWADAMHKGRQRNVLNAIDVLLQSCGFQFCFDITIDDDRCIVIFSPEGDAESADAIDKLLSVRPAMPGWQFFARRPQKDLADAAAVVKNLYFVDPLQTRFRSSQGEGCAVVEMIVPQSTDLTPDEAQGMINTFLWHAVGEDFVMNRGIKGVVRFEDSRTEPSLSAAELISALRHE